MKEETMTVAKPMIRACAVSLFTLVFALALLPGPARAHSQGPLGVPTHVVYAVYDLDTVMAAWSAGIGTQFGPVSTASFMLVTSDGPPQQVTLRRAFSM